MNHVLPGLADVHVHLRVPGGEHKETVASGTAAALAGGYTAVLAMPNTRPPIVDRAALLALRQVFAREARCDVGQYVAGTAQSAASSAAAADVACGLKLYLAETYGSLGVDRLADLQAHFRIWPCHRPIVVHAQELPLAAAIGLAAAYRRWVHVAHVSRAEEIRLIAAAKEAGLPVTCEVTPHHLFLTAADGAVLGSRGGVQPPLASPADVAALWDNLAVIDCLATDHAPHTLAEKDGEHSPPGFPGLETALPLMLTAVYEGRLTLDRLVEMMSHTPARLFGIATPDESSVEVEMGGRWVLPNRGYQTQVDWSPFAGWTVRGVVRRTVLRGQTAWQDGQVHSPAGAGRLIPP